jgi:hypothetical protein
LLALDLLSTPKTSIQSWLLEYHLRVIRAPSRQPQQYPRGFSNPPGVGVALSFLVGGMYNGNGHSMSEIEKIKVARALKKYDGVLPDAPTGPIIEKFDPVRLAEGIEQEIARCRIYGWQKITMHMDIIDAAKLAHVLRRK